MTRGKTKALSLFLGVLMFMFGFLKFFQPFRGWFEVQIQQSHLPHEAILAGKLAETQNPFLTTLFEQREARFRSECLGGVVQAGHRAIEISSFRGVRIP